MKNLKIVSGGQSGADIGGLIAGLEAVKRGYPVETGGWGYHKLATEYDKKVKKVSGAWVTADPGNPEEEARHVGIMTEAGVKTWPVKTTYNSQKRLGEFGAGERKDVMDLVLTGDPKQYISKHDPRTAGNVIDSDATVLFGDIEGGTLDTKRMALKLGRPVLENPTGAELAQWLAGRPEIQTLNVAGRRQSKSGQYGDLEGVTSKTVGDALDILYGANGLLVSPAERIAPVAEAVEQLRADEPVRAAARETAEQLPIDFGSVESDEPVVVELPRKRFAASPEFWASIAALAGAGAAGYGLSQLGRDEEPLIQP